jgi:type I restriction enzyme S subunit
MKWELKTLDELGFVGRGKSRHRPRNAEHLYGGIYPLIQTGDIQKANFYINDYSHTYSEEGLAQSKLWKEGTMVISIVGANTAETAILGFDACFPDSVIGFIPHEGVSDVKFVKYNLECLKIHLKGIAEGTARENLSLEKLLSVKIPTPPLPTQLKIASILSGYDELIENNLRRVRLLEEKAAIMYKVLQNDLKTSEKINLYELADLQMGFAFKADAFNDEGEGTPIIRIRDIPNQITKSYTTQEVDSEYFVEKGDLLIGMDGEFHMNEWLGQRGYLVQRVCRVRAKNAMHQSYLWQALKEPIHYYETTISGATVAHLGKKHLEEIYIQLPKDGMKEVLEEMNTIRKLKVVLAQQTIKLREARDILLPRLMSGEVGV